MRALLVLLLPVAPPAGTESCLRVMSCNFWGGGANEGKDIDETVAALRAARADPIGLREVRTEAPTAQPRPARPWARALARRSPRRRATTTSRPAPPPRPGPTRC